MTGHTAGQTMSEIKAAGSETANALEERNRLADVAPLLLEALKEMVEWFEHAPDGVMWGKPEYVEQSRAAVERARSAIAAATRRT